MTSDLPSNGVERIDFRRDCRRAAWIGPREGSDAPIRNRDDHKVLRVAAGKVHGARQECRKTLSKITGRASAVLIVDSNEQRDEVEVLLKRQGDRVDRGQ